MIDNLARPADPSASRHTIKPSPRYCIRRCPGGFVYMIPFIYSYGWEQMVAAWLKEGGLMRAAPFQAPAYAKSVDLASLTFENPLEIPSDV